MSNAVQETVGEYRRLHDQESVEVRKAKYDQLVNQYYNLVTDFYEFGWGQSFHFAPRLEKERFEDSLRRHEWFLADRIRARTGDKVLDVGCGVGGPARCIAKRTGAHITGVNINAYQLERARHHTKRAKLTSQVSFVQTDFMKLPFEPASFDAVYTIEASCHAPDRTGLFRGLHDVLKPGSYFGGYEWCLTDRFDDGDLRHQKIKKDIEVGNGLPDLCKTTVIDDKLREAGFEVVETQDLAPTGSPATPWYHALTGGDLTLGSLPRTPFGRSVTNVATRVLEKARILPKGTREVSTFLNEGADALVAGGQEGIFTPMYFFLARKPS